MAVVFDIDGKPPLGLPLVFCDIIHQNFCFHRYVPFLRSRPGSAPGSPPWPGRTAPAPSGSFCKPSQPWAVHIQDAVKLTVSIERDHDLGIGGAVTCNMSGKLVDVLHPHRLVLFCRRSADAAARQDPGTGRFSLERPQDQAPVPPQIKSGPVEPLQAVV